MRLNSVVLQNFRQFSSMELSLEESFTVLVGVNGSGKTTLLKAISDALTAFVNRLPLNQPTTLPLAESGIPFLKVENTSDRYRFEPQYPVSITTTGMAFGVACKWEIGRAGPADSIYWVGEYPGDLWRRRNELSDGYNSTETLPIVAFYRANRSWTQGSPTEIEAATQKSSRMDGYASWWDASLDGAALQGWVISKCLERFQVSSETGKLFDQIEDDELALVNAALNASIDGVQGLRFDLKQRSLLVEWAGSDNTRVPSSFENLSDGQKSVVGLIADIARRMCLLNPHLGKRVTKETPGVVLIDELDIHLHPKWQRIVIKGLKSAFPFVQFIAASHSPQVLGELRPGEIALLRSNDAEHPRVSYGLDSGQVLEEIMEARSRASDVGELISGLYSHIEENKLASAKEKLLQLQNIAPGISETAGAAALIKRKELIGR